VLREGSTMVKSESFSHISSSVLRSVLQMDTINAQEFDIVDACIKWAKEQCKQQGIESTGNNMRNALADSWSLIRFPVLSIEEFVEHVVSHDILTSDEGYALFCHIHKKKVELPFTATARCNPFRTTQILIDVQATGTCAVNIGKTYDLKWHMSDKITLSNLILHGQQQLQFSTVTIWLANTNLSSLNNIGSSLQLIQNIPATKLLMNVRINAVSQPLM